ncbi:MAG: potassium transporter TrkG [Bacteroidota bacterium]|nr:potassium transporter TrkG [Bacteroidota bacterium]
MKLSINFSIIVRILGLLLLIESAFILLSGGISLIYGEEAYKTFGLTALIAIVLGATALLITKNKSTNIKKREGFIIVSAVWVVFSFVGALPFIFSGSIPNFTNAFFETISGFTTTGSSVLNNIEALPHGVLFWRSIIQWMGGMGIIVLSLAILPILGIGGMQLFTAEVPGPTPDKFHPRVKQTAKTLWLIYVGFTIAETILLMIGGMGWFDAVNHAFTTMATGGYSTKQASVAHFQNPFIHYVITAFMFLAGTNFALAYYGVKLNFKKIYKNEEFRYYFFFVASFTLITTAVLFLNSKLDLEQSFRDSSFQVVSLMTTTGYATTDYLEWIPFLWLLMFIVMFFGGSAGSTGGGIKIMRIALLLKRTGVEFKRLIHPNAVIPVRFNHEVVSPYIISNILSFVVLYISIFVISTVIMSAMGLDFETAMGTVIATLGNIGPGIGDVGPSENFSQIPDLGKWFLSFLMLVGRLELFTVLLLFSPAFWK